MALKIRYWRWMQPIERVYRVWVVPALTGTTQTYRRDERTRGYTHWWFPESFHTHRFISIVTNSSLTTPHDLLSATAPFYE